MKAFSQASANTMEAAAPTRLRKKNAPKSRKRVFHLPTASFPYKIPKRLDMISQPKSYFDESMYMTPVTECGGVKLSALKAEPSPRVVEVAMPPIRHLLHTKHTYKHLMDKPRLEKIDRLLHASKAASYSKFSKSLIEPSQKKVFSKKTETAWKKHLEHLNELAKPKIPPEPEPISRGEPVPLSAILPRLRNLAQMPEHRIYRRLSEEDWYKKPGKVTEAALSYSLSNRIEKLSCPKIYRTPTLQQLLHEEPYAYDFSRK